MHYYNVIYRNLRAHFGRMVIIFTFSLWVYFLDYNYVQDILFKSVNR